MEELRHTLQGSAAIRRVGRIRFPVRELVQDGVVLARLGRTGWFRVYFGSGQRVELADGTSWTVRARSIGGTVCPVVVDDVGRKVALAAAAHGDYGINGKDWAYELHPTSHPRLGRAGTWSLRRFEEEVALVTRSPVTVAATSPVHLGAVLLSFTLVAYGLPAESAPLIPTFRWGTR